MFVPFVFALDTLPDTENYFHWAQFFVYAAACVKNKWPLISHERYFERFSTVEGSVFGTRLQDVASFYAMDRIPTPEDMAALERYPFPQAKETALIARYPSQFDCWVDLLKNDNAEFEESLGELLDRITVDFGVKPEGVLVYEYLPKALLRAANQRGVPVIFQSGGIIRPPFAAALNACSLVNANSAGAVKARYEAFLSYRGDVPMLSRKGLLRLFIAERYIADVHGIDDEPAYDIGVLLNNMRIALHYTGREAMGDQELCALAKEKYDKVLIRTRPGYERTGEAMDDSVSCFHFCCRCRHVLGFATKGMFEAMLAKRIPHEYGSFLFHSFTNDGLEDDAKGLAPVEFLNFVLFGLCTPFPWTTDPEYLEFLLSGPTEKQLYMRGFLHYTNGISGEDLALYYGSDHRAYRLGDPLYFTGGHKPHEYAAYYCRGGLQYNSGVCTWSNGESTTFAFDLENPPIRPLTVSVSLHGVVMDWSAPNPTQTVTCEANGVACGTVQLVPDQKQIRFTVPPQCAADTLRIVFRYGYVQPVGVYELAVAFERMEIGEEPIPTDEDAGDCDSAIAPGIPAAPLTTDTRSPQTSEPAASGTLGE